MTEASIDHDETEANSIYMQVPSQESDEVMRYISSVLVNYITVVFDLYVLCVRVRKGDCGVHLDYSGPGWKTDTGEMLGRIKTFNNVKRILKTLNANQINCRIDFRFYIFKGSLKSD